MRTMIFQSDHSIDIPPIDILSFLFNETPFHEDDPIWLCPNDPSLFINLSQTRLLTGRIGYGLRSLGVGTNTSTEDIVLTFVENQVMVAPTMFGVICAGAIHSTCPVTATVFELCRQIQLSSPKILICSTITRAIAEEAIRNSGIDIILLVMRSGGGACDVFDQTGKSIMCSRTLEWRRITSQEILERETACLVFSSGTTGIPKGTQAQLLHARLS
jgi:acyl-coenzyme A synthetase/AMP-(fatty) acid ligase